MDMVTRVGFWGLMAINAVISLIVAVVAYLISTTIDKKRGRK